MVREKKRQRILFHTVTDLLEVLLLRRRENIVSVMPTWHLKAYNGRKWEKYEENRKKEQATESESRYKTGKRQKLTQSKETGGDQINCNIQVEQSPHFFATYTIISLCSVSDFVSIFLLTSALIFQINMLNPIAFVARTNSTCGIIIFIISQ